MNRPASLKILPCLNPADMWVCKRRACNLLNGIQTIFGEIAEDKWKGKRTCPSMAF